MSVPYQTPEQPETSAQDQSPQQFEEWLNKQHQILIAIQAQNPWHSVGEPGSPISYLKLGELQARNPRHLRGHVPVELAPPYHRPLAEMLWKRLLNDRPRRHHLILGPRRAGKTTVLYQTVSRLIAEGVEPGRIFWLQVDHPSLLDEDLGNLVEFCIEICAASAEHPAFVMLDEVVYAEKWDRWLKTFHDQRRPVRIVATASVPGELKARHAESGVGRWEEHHLPPYDFFEFVQFASQRHSHSTPPPESPSKHDDPWSGQHRPSTQ